MISRIAVGFKTRDSSIMVIGHVPPSKNRSLNDRGMTVKYNPVVFPNEHAINPKLVDLLGGKGTGEMRMRRSMTAQDELTGVVEDFAAAVRVPLFTPTSETEELLCYVLNKHLGRDVRTARGSDFGDRSPWGEYMGYLSKEDRAKVDYSIGTALRNNDPLIRPVIDQYFTNPFTSEPITQGWVAPSGARAIDLGGD